jgi:hypothetical protein
MADIEAAKPSVDDVALLLRTRTVGYTPPTVGQLGGDTGPSDVTTFSATTRPTATEVTALIETSYDAMIGRLDSTLIASQYEAFSHAVALYTAILIEISYFRESVNEALLAMWTQMINDTLAGIRLAIGREEPITGAQTGFGTLVIGTTVTPALVPPEPDYMPGIDF